MAIAVYADEQDRPVPARETGEEGVACVDDAARALDLYCGLWRRTGAGWLRSQADALLDFLLYMEVAPGRFANFIHDWDGTRNLAGPTSHPEGPFWNARALDGLAAASVAGLTRAAEAFARALAAAGDGAQGADVRAIEVRAVMRMLGTRDTAEGRARVSRWSDQIAALRDGDVLLDHAGQASPHLWAHTQEAVLAHAGALLGRSDLIDIARRSAETVFVPAIASSFDLPVAQPDAVASAVVAMDELSSATGDARYTELAALARAWFAGRNSAGAPVYDRARGRVADGIDSGIVSSRSGAEANIVAGLVLQDVPVPAALPGPRSGDDPAPAGGSS